MSDKKSMKVHQTANGPASKRGPKAPGTRIGTLEDWREGPTKSRRVSQRRANSVRDGR